MTDLETDSLAVVRRAQEERERLEQQERERIDALIAEPDMPVVFWGQPFILRQGPNDRAIVITAISQTSDGQMTFQGQDCESYAFERMIPGRAGG